MSPLALSLHFLQAQPDSRLVALARDGHEPAFEALVRRYRNELLAYCRRLQPRSASAEDALQQTLLQGWKALNAGAEVRDVRPWLYRIAHNVTLNQLRAASSVPQDVSEGAGGQEVHQLVEQRLQARAALAGVASLPDLQREVFVSTMLDGATHEQVASALGLSSGAVRGLIYRARATLRSAAAALTPSPVLHWALRRAEGRIGGARAVSEMVAGGGGAGVAAAIAKGGAVLTLAGAVAGAGGVILTHASSHHHPETRSARPLARTQAHPPSAGFGAAGDEFGTGFAPGAGGGGNETHLAQAAARRASERGRGSAGEDHGGPGGSTGDHDRSRGGMDGGSSATSSGSDGGSATGATIASSSDGGSGSSSGGSSGGSDGGSSGSSSTSTSTTSGSDGGTSGGSGPSGGSQLTTSQTTSGGSSGSDGGSSGSSSGSGDTTTTTTTSH